jgi:hypothetical protein
MTLTLVLWLLSLFQAKPATPAKASPEIQARILKLQLQQTRIQAAFQACQAQDFQGQFNQAGISVQEAINDAFREAKLDKKDWDLNLDSFEFQPKAAPPSPAEKKP